MTLFLFFQSQSFLETHIERVCLHEAKECVAKKVAIILQRDFKRLFLISELIYTDIFDIYTDIFKSDIQAKIQPQAL